MRTNFISPLEIQKITVLFSLAVAIIGSSSFFVIVLFCPRNAPKLNQLSPLPEVLVAESSTTSWLYFVQLSDMRRKVLSDWAAHWD